MDKLKLHTQNATQLNIEKLRQLFPGCVKEIQDKNGKTVLGVDFEALQQELSPSLINEGQESYRFIWPGKKEAAIESYNQNELTLLPVRERSKNFDTTQNIYIEGDNLEAMKILRENYLGQIKVMYWDPPYNTGDDLVYHDDFSANSDSFKEQSCDYNDLNQRFYENSTTTGRFHTDWLNMIYPRLLVAKDLLADDGAIFISIGEEEVDNLKKVCNEVFGEQCFRNTFIARRYDKNLNRQFMENGLKTFNIGFEYIVCYAKEKFLFNPVFKEASEERKSQGYWKGFWNDADRPTMRYDILGFTPKTGQWKWGKDLADEAVMNYKKYEENYSDKMSLEEYWEKTGKKLKFIRRNPNGKGKNAGVENWIAPTDKILRNTNWLDILASRADESTQGLFDFPKNVDLIKLILQSATNKDCIVFDCFSGSATTAQAVMELNKEDGGNRKFILVQLQEETKEGSDASKSGYKTICDIGEERIRRAGSKIDPGNNSKIDIGFRVMKVDSSNMKDVYYSPSEYTKELNLFDSSDNIKSDRSDEDLLFEILPMMNIPLSSKIEKRKIGGKDVFFVENNYLIASFATGLTDDIITEIAKMHPMYFVMADRSAASDSVISNFETIFKQYSSKTITRIL